MAMWGDPVRAASLQGNDPLSTLLFQISSPAHIPFGDQRWQELLHGYDVWVHMEDTGESADSAAIIGKACESMAKHAALSSNLAALSLHVTRMLRQLVRDIQRSTQKTAGDQQPSSSGDGEPLNSATADFSRRISRVGKARATAGALQLLRLLCHPVVQSCGAIAEASGQQSANNSRLEEALLYRTRGDLPCDQPAGRPLVYSILDLITVTGQTTTGETPLETPEIYDATVISVQLLLVLCGTQLYQPFVSSFQASEEQENYENYILDELLRDQDSCWSDETVVAKNYALFSASSRSLATQFNQRNPSGRRRQHLWTPLSILRVCMQWQIRRPVAPERSIAYYYFTMAQAAVKVRGGETLGRDGMYESYMIVHATAPTFSALGSSGSDGFQTTTAGGGSRQELHHHRGTQNMIIDATKGVFVLGSTIIMLPFRLMSLVFGVITSQKKQRGGDDAHLLARKIKSYSSSRTRDVLWLSDSILADLVTSLILLLVNNRRNGNNPFRNQLGRLSDNRWEQENDQAQGLPDLPTMEPMEVGEKEKVSISMKEENTNGNEVVLLSDQLSEDEQLAVNFESLFESFGRTLHTEIGALMLYTLHQTCPTFAASLAVRSDLDTLVLPLLRTLYFSSNTMTYVATDFVSRKNKTDASSTTQFDIRSCPFRSQSQLYVIIILLLLFSQDSSFGRDAFRRISVTHVLWYKERNLRNINLGSVVLLTLLRSVMFNLRRLQDAFLLSNCCAILQNMSPPIVDLHDYAAMRLASVTVSVMKKHLQLHADSKAESSAGPKSKVESNELGGYMSTPLSMYEEVARTLLRTIHDCLSSKTIDRNLHLVYALVYHQVDFNRIFNNDNKLYPSSLVHRIQCVTQEASAIITEDSLRTASLALKALEEKIDRLQNVTEKKRKKVDTGDFTFSYEEEADPEIFFVPYVWETIVCVVTSSIIEWKKDNIRAFRLLDPVDQSFSNEIDMPADHSNGQFAKAVEELV